MGGSATLVKECDLQCPLYPWRLGKEPKKTQAKGVKKVKKNRVVEVPQKL